MASRVFRVLEMEPSQHEKSVINMTPDNISENQSNQQFNSYLQMTHQLPQPSEKFIQQKINLKVSRCNSWDNVKIRSLSREAFKVDDSMIKEYKRLEKKASEPLPLSTPLQNNIQLPPLSTPSQNN